MGILRLTRRIPVVVPPCPHPRRMIRLRDSLLGPLGDAARVARCNGDEMHGAASKSSKEVELRRSLDRGGRAHSSRAVAWIGDEHDANALRRTLDEQLHGTPSRRGMHALNIVQHEHHAQQTAATAPVNGDAPSSYRPSTTTSGSSTTAPRTTARPTTSPPRCPTSSTSCNACGSSKPPPDVGLWLRHESTAPPPDHV
jgi:hypothetical protein